MNKIWNNFTYFFRRKYHQISRVIDFLPLIWKGFDFDYRYSIDLFKHQLKRTADHLESDRAISMSAGDDAKRIRTAVELLDRVYDEDYGMEWMGKLHELYGENVLDWNFEDIGSGGGSSFLKYEYEKWENAEEIDEVKKFHSKRSYEKQQKAEELVWKFISHNIRRWWD